MLTIGQLAEMLDISTVTLRYYEKQHLIPPASRSSGRHRLYPESVIPRLQFIQRAKAVGFTLEEVCELLDLQLQTNAPSQAIKNLVLKKLQMVQEKIAALQSMKQTLTQLASSCDGQEPISQCPILKTLAHKGK